MLDESIDALNIKAGGTYIDATLGGGGHSLEILKKLDSGLVIGVDQDEVALKLAREKLASHANNIRMVRANFSQIEYIMQQAQISHADGVLMDLGVSSFQLDDGSRGFSYNHDAKLDMRMDERQDLTAYDVVNKYTVGDLTRIFHNYGEEKWAKRIAEFILDKRAKDPIETTFQLTDVIKAAIPKAARADGPHPARRVFQAIRIEVNGELAILEQALEDYIKILHPGGRICVITFHSLEDRLVKNTFRRLSESCVCPRDFPICICNTNPYVEIVTKKPIVPKEEELSENHRARSAKLRVAQRI